MPDVRDRLLWILIGVAAVITCGLTPLLAGSAPVLSADGLTAYDAVNNVTWLADANLAAGNRFGLPACHGSSIDTKTCVNPSGSMSYQAAAAWVAAMNAANYLGHNTWQLPTTPTTDNACQFTLNGNSVGFKCSRGALGYLYYTALGLQAPDTTVSIPNNTAGPFSNFQPYLYWTQTSSSQNLLGRVSFSLNSGFQSSSFDSNFLYVLPMIEGKLPGTPAATGNGLQVNPDGQTVYDPLTNITWLANANLAATNTFGLPICLNSITSKPCVNHDGSMNFGSANQFVVNMHSAAYLGQTGWNLAPADPSCEDAYVCATTNPPFQGLFSQLGLNPGMPIVAAPNVAVGPFHNIQPYLYWSCKAATIQDACQTDGPASGFEFSFSFGNGYLDTDALANDLYVTAYFVGSRTPTTGPVIAEVANAEGDSPLIAPNTWVQIKGVNLAPAGFSSPDCAPGYCWQSSDFVNNTMPTQLNHVSATVNGKNAYVYYISPTQINILTPPDAMSGPVQVVVTNGGTVGAAFTAQAQSVSPSLFVFNGTYVAAEHLDFSFVGPVSLYPGLSTPAKPGEIVSLYANGFGPTLVPVVSGSATQSGSLPAPPVIKIGGENAIVQYYSLVGPGEFLFNVVVPATLADGDQPITATYNGSASQPGTLITIQH